MYGVRGQHGVTWGHRGQILIFTYNALSPLCYIALTCNSYIIISLRPSTYFMGSKVNLGLPPPAGYAVFDGNMSSSFLPCPPQRGRVLYCISFFLACWCTSRLLYLTCFFLSFFLSFFFFFLSFWQHAIFTYFPKLDFDQTWPKWPDCWPLLGHKQRWRQRSRRGHTGQKRGQKRVNFHQKRINSYRLRSIDTWLMHIYQLEPLYKSYGPKKISGVIWGHRGQT